MIENALLDGLTIRKPMMSKNRQKSVQRIEPLSQDREFVRSKSNFINQSVEGITRYKVATTTTGTMRNQEDVQFGIAAQTPQRLQPKADTKNWAPVLMQKGSNQKKASSK